MAVKLIYNKSSFIKSADVHQKVLIYNGKNFQKLIILKEMVGHRFGEFIVTRKFVPFKKKKNG
jgi:ribosomal protein S19